MTSQPCTTCEKPAGWTCATCGARCAEHVRRRRERLVRFACVTCRAEATLVRVRRSELTTFRDRLKPALLGTLLGRSLLSIVLVALLFSTSAWLGFLGLLLGFVPLGILVPKYARATADGEPFDWPDVSDAQEELGLPLAKLSVTLAPFLVLMFLGIQVGVIAPWETDSRRLQSLAMALLSGPTFWAAVLPTLACLPMVLLGALVAERWWDGLNPRRAVRVLKQWREPYSWMVLVAFAGFVLACLVRWMFAPGWFGGFAGALVGAYTVFALARLVGELVWLQPDAFGWGRSDEAWVDVGDPKAPELEPEQRELTPTPVRSQSTFTGQIAAALAARDVPLMLRLFTEHNEQAQSLPVATLMKIGQAAASVNEYATAMDALLAAARGTGEDSSKALVIAARILDERLRDHPGAKRLYDQVLERFPGTSADAWAREQLKDPRFLVRRNG